MIGSIIGIIIIIGGINLYRTFALYKEEQSFNVLNGVVPYFKKCSVEKGQIWTFDYIGSEKEFIVPCDGTYRIELWGASGFGDKGGLGSYTFGEIDLNEKQKLYVYIGEQGILDPKSIYGTYGFNGGSRGSSTCKAYYDSIGKDSNGHTETGGGATDIRLINGSWDNFDGLKTRIMVAAGGSAINQNADGVPGGGLNGYNGGHGTGATQTSAGGPNKGGFGYGGTPKYGGAICSSSIETGAGSGYYGGGAWNQAVSNSGMLSAGSGSSFISGHEGCDAIKEESTATNIQHTGKSNHYSGYIFRNTKMVDGAGYSWTTTKGEKTNMPTHDGLGTMVGNTGNGYAKITYLGKNA